MCLSDLESRDGRVLDLLSDGNTEEEASTVRLDVCTSHDYLGGSRRKVRIVPSRYK